MIADAINAVFELGGGLAVFAHCRAVLRDREVHGVSWLAVLFFTLWGFWNLLYYPHLGQWMSFWCGMLIVIGNTTWIVLIIKFRRARKKSGGPPWRVPDPEKQQ